MHFSLKLSHRVAQEARHGEDNRVIKGKWVMKRLLFVTTACAAVLASQAYAADLPMYTKAPPPPPPPPLTWAGFYLGGNVGYGWSSNSTGVEFLPTPVAFGTLNTSFRTRAEGVIGGAQIGYNWQVYNFVYGLEADFQGSGIRGSNSIVPLPFGGGAPALGDLVTSHHQLDWFGTVRGRVGFAFTPELLFYGTGGFAYGSVRTDANEFFDGGDGIIIPHPASISDTRTGWSAGGGIEWMFTRGWSAKAEYLHIDLGNVSATALEGAGPLGVRYTWRIRDDIARVGINYHF
jgi:outer membrane immunogenic protein